MKQDWANIKKYESENKILLATTPTTERVVFMGDSITEFWKSYDATFFESTNINRGISGQTTPQMLGRFIQDVVYLQPKKVVLLAGINDIAENTGAITNQEICDNIIKMILLAQSNAIEVILCSVLPANRFSWNAKIQPANRVIALNNLLLNYCTKSNCTFVDYYSAMVDSEKGLQKQYGEDGVHPNNEGYKIMETILLNYL